MTEAEWQAGRSPADLLAVAPLTVRKARLLGVACCRRFQDWMPDTVGRMAVAAAERYADRQASDEDLTRHRQRAEEHYTGRGNDALMRAVPKLCWHDDCVRTFPEPAVTGWAGYILDWLRDVYLLGGPEDLAERAAQADLVREVVGNPFRRAAPDPAWLSSTVVGLAEGIYDGREFDRLPILADALEEAGCDDAEVLAHCRSDGPHVRGCWALDLVLGKE